MIRRTEKKYKEMMFDWKIKPSTTHTVLIFQTTYWFLFIPMYVSKEIIKDNLS